MARKSPANEKMWQRSSTRIRFTDEDMDFNFLVPLAFGAERGSAIGECFYIASRIKEGDPTSWAQEWTAYAERLQSIAEAAEASGAHISAGETYLRAFTYNRTGTMAQRPSQPEARATYDAMRHCFRKAMALLELPVETVQIPYGETTLPGYFMYGTGSAPRPTIITTHGGEMFADELFFWMGAAGMRRGYNVLSVDTPGGPSVRFAEPDQDLVPFVEGRIRALVDYAVGRPETDPTRLAVTGFSGGAYMGMRLTSLDQRVKALIASAPIYDLYALASAEFPPALQKAPAFVGNMLLKVATSMSPWTNVSLERILWAAGVSKPSELLDSMKQLGPVNPTAITCPMLCLTGASESETQNDQARYVYTHLPNAHKAFHIFTLEEGADAHCQNNNLLRFQQVMYDWLDGVFAMQRP